MLDDFRQQADSGFFDEEPEEEAPSTSEKGAKGRGGSDQRILGMTPVQRFVIAALFLVLTCLFSALCLLMTGKIVPVI